MGDKVRLLFNVVASVAHGAVLRGRYREEGSRWGIAPVRVWPRAGQYLATDTTTARDRVKLFRLAWDIVGSAFESRQALYERFVASDPLTRARALNALYPKEEVIERVRRFLDEETA